MHLDADERWSIGSGPTDLYTVVLHELGHALGLGHSDRPGAVMYPYYRSITALSSDDIEGIQSLYGKRDAPQAPQSPNVPAPLRITVASPAPSSTTDAATIALSGSASGGQPPIVVRWQSDRGPAGPAIGSPDWRVDAVPLSEGANLLTVTGIDASGASAAAAVTVTKAASEPSPKPASSTAPGLRITYPARTIIATSTASISLRGTATGSAAKVTWSSSAGFSGEGSGVATWTAEVPLYIGTNTITVRAQSETGAQAWRAVTVVRR
jgi:hypothetical protein